MPPRSYSMKMVEDQRPSCLGRLLKFLLIVIVVVVVLAVLSHL